MWSGPMANRAPCSGRPPWMVTVLVPIPSISAPSATRNRARSCTCGSDAALRSTVRPRAATAAISAFSVPVTLASSRNTSAPTSAFASKSYVAPTAISAPRRCSASRWVSIRRRPMTSPPGGGRRTRPNRASSGPASSTDARIFPHSAGSGSPPCAPRASTASVCPPSHAALAPSETSSSHIVSTSRMRGMFSRMQGPSARSVAARIGSAAFLLPAGRTVPERRCPPSTTKRGAMAHQECGPRARSVKAIA